MKRSLIHTAMLWRRNFYLLCWSFKVTIAHAFGRWYFFRNYPNWFVRTWATMEEELVPADDELRPVVEVAKAEWRLRLSKMRK